MRLNMDLDDIFRESFLNGYNENTKKKLSIHNEERTIAENKKKQLSLIAQFLDKAIENEIYVKHADSYSLSALSLNDLKPQKFTYRYEESSQSWAPGISIVFDHPAEVEVAIPNKPEEEGVVKIHLGSTHPSAYLFQGTFSSHKQACEALGRFLGKSTTSMGKQLQSAEKPKQNKELNPAIKNSQSYFSVKRGEDEES